MTRSKILGLALGASLLLGYEPIAEATPMAAPPSVVETSAFSGNVNSSARLESNAATSVASSVASIATSVASSVASIATSVAWSVASIVTSGARYVDTTEL